MSDAARPNILVVEDDADMRQMLEEELPVSGFDVAGAASAAEALARLEERRFDVVVTDQVMPGLRGSDLLVEIRARQPELPVIIMTAFGSVDAAVEAMKGGAFHYLTKPFRIEQLLDTIRSALATGESPASGAAEAEPIPGVVAVSPGMQRAIDLLRRAAPADTALLILGESGTGKEKLARAVHRWSPRREGPFIAVNCAAIPEALLESQLFGYRRGAFTDAKEDRRGLFVEARGGTLFLDEIGDLPLALQGKLLRVLQEREVHPLGAAAPVPIDVRVLAATHRDLQAECTAGRFRLDLYYRLNVIAVRIPPLRERPEDLEPLVAHFLREQGQRLGRPGRRLAPEVMERFRVHAWRGNVRELENVIERALVLGSGERIGLADLPDEFQRAPVAAVPGRVRSLAEVEREQIIEALRAASGNKTAAARALGLDRKTLYRKIELYEIAEDTP